LLLLEAKRLLKGRDVGVPAKVNKIWFNFVFFVIETSSIKFECIVYMYCYFSIEKKMKMKLHDVRIYNVLSLWPFYYKNG